MKAQQDGFTLIETVMVFVIGSFLAIMIITMMSAALTRSSTSIGVQHGDFLVEQALAQVTRDYVSLTNNETTRATALTLLKANVDSGSYNQTSIITATSAFVTYDASGTEGIDASGDDTTLKVTVSRANGRTMSALYSKARPDPTTQLVWY